MHSWEDAGKGAMNAEEAALLPALPRRSEAGQTALRDRLNQAARMKDMKMGQTWSGHIDAVEKAVRAAGVETRAALHHVLK
ncbi:MAG: hypothetical protein IJ662_06630 [Clostridia bacterium]|nr:hypothetical protein [Clostridia bacterium]